MTEEVTLIPSQPYIIWKAQKISSFLVNRAKHLARLMTTKHCGLKCGIKWFLIAVLVFTLITCFLIWITVLAQLIRFCWMKKATKKNMLIIHYGEILKKMPVGYWARFIWTIMSHNTSFSVGDRSGLQAGQFSTQRCQVMKYFVLCAISPCGAGLITFGGFFLFLYSTFTFIL